MSDWIQPRQNWDNQSHPVDVDLNRIESNTQYLKDQTDEHQRQIDGIKGGEAVPEAIHSLQANNATNAANANNATKLNGWSVVVAAEGSKFVPYGTYGDVKLGNVSQHHFYIISVHAGGQWNFSYDLVPNVSGNWWLRIRNYSTSDHHTFYYKVLELVI